MTCSSERVVSDVCFASVTDQTFVKCHQAAIYFEATHTGPNHVQRVDALVEQASTPLRPDGSPGLLFAEREEISCVHLEVSFCSSARSFCFFCSRQHLKELLNLTLKIFILH